jgi:hypothetical protein
MAHSVANRCHTPFDGVLCALPALAENGLFS